jgi:DNA repair protein RadC
MRRPSLQQLKYRLPRIELFLVHEEAKERTVAIRTPKDAAQFLAPLKHAPEEHFISLHLNARNEVIGLHEVSHGTLSTSLVHPREVFKTALVANSFAIIVCHNHPSGAALSPSIEDMNTTRQLLDAGKILGINVIDHLILSPRKREHVYSIREHHPQLWVDERQTL